MEKIMDNINSFRQLTITQPGLDVRESEDDVPYNSSESRFESFRRNGVITYHNHTFFLNLACNLWRHKNIEGRNVVQCHSCKRTIELIITDDSNMTHATVAATFALYSNVLSQIGDVISTQHTATCASRSIMKLKECTAGDIKIVCNINMKLTSNREMTFDLSKSSLVKSMKAKGAEYGFYYDEPIEKIRCYHLLMFQ